MPKGVYPRKKRKVTRAKRRKPGRPKGSKNKSRRANAPKAAARRGRPPGSGIGPQLTAIGARLDERMARIEALLRNASAPVFVQPAAMPAPVVTSGYVAQVPSAPADPS